MQQTGPLAGLTVVIKDMYDIAGERTGGGNPDWLAAQQPATKNAAVVQKLLDAGATITGKTICDEFFYSVAGVNAHYGTPVNPRAPDRLPGGSSSGSASAAASDACDFAIGSDTGGSIRVPSSFCGLYGIRTTHGRVESRRRDAHGGFVRCRRLAREWTRRIPARWACAARRHIDRGGNFEACCARRCVCAKPIRRSQRC